MGPDSIKSRSSRGGPLIACSPLSRGSSYRLGTRCPPADGTATGHRCGRRVRVDGGPRLVGTRRPFTEVGRMYVAVVGATFDTGIADDRLIPWVRADRRVPTSSAMGPVHTRAIHRETMA